MCLAIVDSFRNCEKGWSVSVERSWVRDDENEWPEAALWIKDQHDRLLAIAGDTSQVRQGHATRTNPQRPKDGTKTGRVWALADRHRTREATIAAAVAEGINSGTARAQFVRWHRAQREPTPKV